MKPRAIASSLQRIRGSRSRSKRSTATHRRSSGSQFPRSWPTSKPLSGDQNPCTANCARIGSLIGSADGRYVYVGDSGDVIDTKKREVVTNLEALHNSRVAIEVVFSDGKPSYPLLPG